MPTNAPNPSEDQEDPELEMMDPLTNDIEKSLKRDFKRIRQDKYQEAQKGQRLKKADFDFEVDSVEQTHNGGGNISKSSGSSSGNKTTQMSGANTVNPETTKQHNAQSRELKKAHLEKLKEVEKLQDKRREAQNRVDEQKRNSEKNRMPGDKKDWGDDWKEKFSESQKSDQQQKQAEAELESAKQAENNAKNEASDLSRQATEAADDVAPEDLKEGADFGYGDTNDKLDNLEFDENGKPKDDTTSSELKGKQPEVTLGGAATGDNPLDPTKQGRGGAALGQNPAQMGTESNMDSYKGDKFSEDPDKNIVPGSLEDYMNGGKAADAQREKERVPGSLKDFIEDSKKPKQNSEKETARQLKEKQQSYKAQKAAMMASMMTGGANLPKSGAGGGKEAFKAGGGPSDPSQFDAQKKPAGGMKGAAQKAGAAVGGAMDKGKQAADAVKRQVDSAKQAAKKVKDTITAPARKLAAAKDAVSNFMDSMNPLKRLKKLFKSVSITQLIGGLIRLLLTSKGFGKFVEMFDKLVKEENANRCYTCAFCCNCLIQAIIPFLPLIIILLVAAAMTS